MSLDETRMSISSDDFNRSISSSSVTNVPIKKGNNIKKMRFWNCNCWMFTFIDINCFRCDLD